MKGTTQFFLTHVVSDVLVNEFNGGGESCVRSLVTVQYITVLVRVQVNSSEIQNLNKRVRIPLGAMSIEFIFFPKKVVYS